MAASVTHLVVGETVFNEAQYLGKSPETYGAFLMGCILVDVHAFHPIDRRVTHFVGRVEEDGEAAYRMSCANFLGQLGSLLQRPWRTLDGAERAFVTGYLCHLAADECWKEMGKNLFDQLGISDWANFPVPGDISLTVFDCRSFARMADPVGAQAALDAAPIPDVFTHVSGEMLRDQWRIIRDYVFAGGTAQAHITMLEKAYTPAAKIQSARAQYARCWQDALDFTDRTVGGVGPFLADAVRRSMQVLPALVG